MRPGTVPASQCQRGLLYAETLTSPFCSASIAGNEGLRVEQHRTRHQRFQENSLVRTRQQSLLVEQLFTAGFCRGDGHQRWSFFFFIFRVASVSRETGAACGSSRKALPLTRTMQISTVSNSKPPTSFASYPLTKCIVDSLASYLLHWPQG